MLVDYDRKAEKVSIEDITLHQQKLIIDQVEAQTAISADDAGWVLNADDGSIAVSNVIDQVDLAAVFEILGKALMKA